MLLESVRVALHIDRLESKQANLWKTAAELNASASNQIIHSLRLHGRCVYYVLVALPYTKADGMNEHSGQMARSN
jgi:hypothetical protein